MSSIVQSGTRALMALTLAWGALGAHAAASVGVLVQISQPGVYGRVDIGEYPRPEVVVQRPVVIRPAPRARHVEPVYLWVPPGHQRNWGRHCREYGACGVPVYFVRDRWYNDHVMVRRDDHRGGHGSDARREYDDRGDDRRHVDRSPQRGDRRDDRTPYRDDDGHRRGHEGH